MSKISSKQSTEDVNIIKFTDFMRAKRLKKNDNGEYEKRITHTVMSGKQAKEFYGGSFHISGKEYNAFIKYYKLVLSSSMKLHIVERPNEVGKMVGPFIVDIDYKSKSCERQYTETHIEKIIKICNDVFSKYLDTNDDKLRSYVLEKEEPSYEEKNKNYKDGFHIFYDLPISCNKRLFFFDKIKEKITKEDIFSDIEHTSSYYEIVDESVMINNGLLMFGSCKEGRNPYKLTHVYNRDIEEEPIEEYQNTDDLVNLFSLQQYTDDDDIEFVEKYSEVEKDLNNKENIREERKKKNKVEKQLNNNNNNKNYAEINSKFATKDCYELTNIPEHYGQIYEFIDMMSVKRATEYNGWIRVGWALHGISKKLYKLFLHFSKKAKNYDEDSCYKVWREANRDGVKISLSTIKIWAKEDNPQKYDEVYNSKLKELSEKTETHDDLANIVHEMYRDYYKCVSISKNLWYEFQDHRWVLVDSGYSLHEKINSEVTKKLVELKKYLMDDASDKNGFKHDEAVKSLKNFCNVMMKLKDQNYVSTLMKACSRKFYDAKFIETLDSNVHLLGFENGVYDLRVGLFRDGMPDDRITFSTGYDYIEYSENDKIIREISDFISKIQSKDTIREYILRLFSSCLDGKNRDQMFHIFTGSGGNGKSKLIDLLVLSLGKYASPLSSCVLTNKDKDANGASPELAGAMGKRLLIIQEPPADSDIRTEKIKILTGGDKVVARKLYCDPFEYTPQYKILCICNKLPEIPEKGNDGGVWRRMCVTPFNSKFIKDKTKVNHAKDVYLADTSLDNEKMAEWGCAFMWMLLKLYYPLYIKSKEEDGGLKIPDEVMSRTEKYKKDSDIYLEFLRDFYIVTHDDSDKESMVSMYNAMREWYNDNYSRGNHIKISKKDLENNLESCQNLRVDSAWVCGVKLKILNKDEEN